MSRRLVLFAMLWALIALPGEAPGAGPAPKYGGVLNIMQREELPVGVAIHETSTISTIWPAMPCFNNLVLFDPMQGVVIDDPDVNYYENFGCGSVRNYTGYCDEQIARLIDQQSQELDPKRRLVLVREIQKRFEEEAVRPIMGWRLDYFAQWPHVRNLVPHNSNYSFGRLQDVWLDRCAMTARYSAGGRNPAGTIALPPPTAVVSPL